MQSFLSLLFVAVVCCVLRPVSATYVSSAAVTVSGTTTTITSTTLVATETDESVLLAEESGVAYASSVTFIKSGNTSSTEDSSQSALNAAIAIQEGGTVYLTDCYIETDDLGSNALHTYEDGTYAYLYNLDFYCAGEFGHGIYTAGGYIYAEDLTGSTYGTSSSAIATDTGGGIILVNNAEVYTYGSKSALVYSTGNITVNNLTGSTAKSPACVIDGSNSWTLNDPAISAAPNEHAVFQFMSTVTSSSGNTAYAYVTGGSVSETGGTYGLVFVSNIAAYVYLTDVSITIDSGILANISTDDWGTSGSNGGDATIVLSEVDVSGDVYVDDISTLELDLADSSTLTGTVNADNSASSLTISLDSSSTWEVTGDSYVTVLEDDDTTYSNINSNGYTIYYGSLSSSSGETISLTGGGSLTPT
ncbi:hypothetical protein B0J13DRAFT_508746 [Dactylonectria estremocensis]|uniref:Uncharacterized protein n=1 Tax=Dactylonectria estremocensis TaxID=1079267 RepID=A0A9P9E6X4_9HYPO|nr:hypothetical protein B0J13DRAFT_508746 [Dactylonectria estremocensis]